MLSLNDLCGSVGKSCDKWTLYIDVYEKLFRPFRRKSVSILEIGVQNGGFTETLAKYFTRASKIVGCDINPACASLPFDDPRISIVIGDAASDDTSTRVRETCAAFDIVIDDASHKSSDIVRSFCHYYPQLKEGGLYIVEDLHASYWREFDGGLFDSASSMGFLKLLPDVINYPHWENRQTRSALLAPILTRYGGSLSETDLASVASVQFVNSMAIIRKQGGAASLGKRLVSAGAAAVADNYAYDSLELVAPDQRDNPFSNMELASSTSGQTLFRMVDDLCRNLRADFADAVQKIDVLSQAVKQMREELTRHNDGKD